MTADDKKRATLDFGEELNTPPVPPVDPNAVKAAARAAGCLVSFDTNLRLKLWSKDRARAIMTDVKPLVMAEMQVDGWSPWSRWRQTGICGYSSAAPRMR